MRFVAGCLFLAVVFVWIYASSNSWLLWAHLHFPPHQQRMARARLCVEAAEHFGGPVAITWIKQAYRLCDDCGCSFVYWPSRVRAYFE